MSHLVEHPPTDFAAVNKAVLSDLGVTRAGYSAGPLTETAGTAEVRVTEDLGLAGIGTFVVHTTLRLEERAGHWLVDWSPSTIDPALTESGHFAVTTIWPPRAPILGAGGAPLTSQAPMVVVGVEGNYVKDPVSLSEALIADGAPPPVVSAALVGARAHPTWFEPVFTITKARYLELKPTLYPLAGTVFQAISVRAAITPGLEAHLVGSVGPVTAQELSELGAPYGTNSVVGQTGLEQAYQSQLAGTPGATITLVSAKGTTEATLARFPPRPGRPLETSIDPVVQKAAEAALAGETKSSALVAVQATTGQVLAVVSDPASEGFDQALDGEFPPGSTFKTVTSTALIEKGLSPASAASCPPSITVDGEVFHNAEGDSPVLDLAQAFAESCNTAFIGLATSHLGTSSLPASAALYDIGKTPAMGLVAFGGDVPRPTDEADLAATAIGQGQVVVSPLDMAMVAADIDAGTVHEPRLVVGAPDDHAPTRNIAKEVVNDLHEMMAEVVASGTAANTGLPPGTFAKTGTAEYGAGNPPPTDAWLIGFNGDVAFAVVVVDGGYGGPTDGPIVAKFLDALGRGWTPP
jgi:cell division protein FtsI/penicillin-binding protein 2